MQKFKVFSLSMWLQIWHYKTKHRITTVFKKEIIKEEKKLAAKEKNTASANINSREMLKIEYQAKLVLDVNLSENYLIWNAKVDFILIFYNLNVVN